MRALGAKKGIGIGLAVVLVAVAVSGWLYFRSDGDEDERIVVGVTARPDFLDPSVSYQAGSWDLYSNVYQGLMTLGPGQDEPVPDAAESCEFTDEAYTVFRCTLRTDLTFSSGRDIEPEDVQFSVERIMAMAERAEVEAEDDSIPEDEKFQYAGPISLLRGVEAVRVDNQDIIFELDEPDVTFPSTLAGGVGSIVDREEYEMEEPTEHVVGSGPFILDDFVEVDDESGTPGHAMLEPNENYRGALEIPEHPVELRHYPSPNELQEAWENNEIDVNGGEMDPDGILAVDPNDLDIRYSETTGRGTRLMVLNMADGHILSEPVVRRSIVSLLDRETLASDVHQHTAEPAYSLIPIGVTGHGTPYRDRYGAATPEDVADDLQAAGYDAPISFSLGYATTEHAAEAEMLKRQLEADGLFEIEVREYPNLNEAIDEDYVGGELDAFTVGWRPDFSDPDTYTDALLNEDSTMMHGYVSEEIRDLIGITRAEPERGATGELFREVHDMAAEEALVVPLTQDRNYAIADREITGLQYLRDAAGQFRLWQLGRI